MKIANVVPLFKSGCPMLFNNYRPVSLLPTLSKVFEKIMYNRVLDFLNEMKILFDLQFGFRKLHSTYMALMILMDKITKLLDNGDYIVGIFLDFSKAFDTVDHNILLKKLHFYGIRGTCLTWFQSYLTNRVQFVTYNNVKSVTKNIVCGVPQGSILGPLLFLVYINDLCLVCKHSIPLLFADDTNLFINGQDLTLMSSVINKELADISQWLKVNKLSLNIDKTKFMIFTRKKKASHEINLYIDNKSLSETNVSKFLGVLIDNKLNWKQHIAYVAGKVSRGIGIIIKARQYLPKDCLKTLYYSFIYPYLIYCNHIWGSTYQSSLSKLTTLQKKAVRIISHSTRRSPSEPLFLKLSLLNLKKINFFLIGMFMFRTYKKAVPDVFDGFFKHNREFHTHDTRTMNCLHIPSVRSDLSKTGIRFQGANVWNHILKADLNLDTSELSFKLSLKKYLLQI
jgi:hypothetical protein